MKIDKINHLGIAVENLEQAAQVYEAMGLHVEKVIEVPEQKVRVAFIPIGESTIELVQPTSEDSTVAVYLEKRGEGLHHLALQVDDIAAALSELEGQGMRLIDRSPARAPRARSHSSTPRAQGAC